MTRELKFRARDTEQNKWIISGEEGGFSILGEVNVFDMLREYSIADFKKIEITQFTGRKDKNGKDIYGGDIGHFDRSPWEVRFEKGSFNFVPYGVGDEFPFSEYTAQHFSVVEVIGNIYDNVSLLTTENSK